MNEQSSLWDEPQSFTAGLSHASVERPTGVSFDGRPVKNIIPDWRKLVRRDAPDTSIQAAKKTVKRISQSKQKILDILSLHPEGLCDEQIARFTGMKENTASARRGNLVTDGLVKYAGHTRLTSTNSNAKVWILA